MSIFKGYDIRGVYGETLNEKIAVGIGKAFATLLLKKKLPNRKLFIGRDNRRSSPGLRNAIANPLHFAGFDIVDLGVASTPLVQYAISREKCAGAVIVTASHNPAQYNGFKLYLKNLPLMGADMHGMERIFKSGKFLSTGKQGHELSRPIEGEYIGDVLGRVRLYRKMRVVIDSGNGTCGAVARELLTRMGCSVISLFEDMESAFLNHIADPHDPKNLKWLSEEVVRQRADLGIAFDGDGDRAGFVDNAGKPIREDDVAILFLRHELEKAGRDGGKKGSIGKKVKLPKSSRSIVYDLRLSRAVPEEVKKLRGKPIMSKAGRIAIRENLIAQKALFGGEVSGHYFFADHFGFDDGIYAGAKMCEIVSGLGMRLSDAVKSISHYPATPEIRLHCDNEKKFKLVENVKKILRKKYGSKILTIDGVYLNLEDAWGLLRVSNTEPAITLRFEGKTKKDFKDVYGIFGKLLKGEGIKLPILPT
ncbi:MAG: phosphomannomutase/phosphoglucomutase [Candidatus Micrarchaeota archaeon]